MTAAADDIFSMVPMEPAANLEFRRRLLEQAEEDTDLQQALLEQASEDIHFFFNVFLFTFDPRTDQKHFPFIEREYQREFVEELKAAIIEGHDLHVDKSRDMGATWIILGVFLWFWLFVPDTPLKCASRNEDLVDKKGDPDCIFWKLDYLVSYLPAWMRPKPASIDRVHMTLVNLDNGSTINGESTNQNIGRGGRQKAVFLDEFPAMENQASVLSATADSTPCRLFVGTPNGDGDEFARMRKNPAIRHISLHWSRHPDKAAGMYRFMNGQVEILDKAYKFPPDFSFVVEEEGRLRSPWYDAQCLRRTPQQVAQEIDINYNRSGSTFFNTQALGRMEAMFGKPPVYVGELAFKLVQERVHLAAGSPFRPVPRGRLRVWKLPQPGRVYVVTADISLGQGASNTVISVGDKALGEKVACYVDPNLMPHEAAAVAKALSKWYSSYNGDSFIMWEANGPGLIFGKTILRLGHAYYYLQRQTEDVRAKQTRTPGWHSGGVNKQILLSEYDVAIARGKLINPDKESIAEAYSYVHFDDGSIGPGELQEMSSGARANHGDRVIADALIVLAFREVGYFKPPASAAPPGSFAAMQYQRRLRESRRDDRAWRP
jgi:hypothetical protein